MRFELCERCGIDGDAVARRVDLIGLADLDKFVLGESLQQKVIRPQVKSIMGAFLDSMLKIDEFREIVDQHSDFRRLEDSLTRYLLSLGVGYDRQQYFEERLRIGSVHHSMGVPQSLYQCSLQILQSILIRHIPAEVRKDPDDFDALLNFILQITSLDMSLAVESYCTTRMCGLEDSLRDERGESERLRRLAITDWLTDLHNHSYSRTLLAEELQHAQDSSKPLCVIMADLDQFKQINDAHGHLVGDHVLRITAARMVSGARVHDEIGRYGGEEFLFVLRETDIDTAAEVAERVRARISSDVIHHQRATISVSLSLGIAQARADDTVDTLIQRADSALYAAKLAGRNCVFLEAASG